ncbi:MAG: hypothetical protein ACRCT1_22115 [Microcoleaceae cyanobacterium]
MSLIANINFIASSFFLLPSSFLLPPSSFFLLPSSLIIYVISKSL